MDQRAPIRELAERERQPAGGLFAAQEFLERQRRVSERRGVGAGQEREKLVAQSEDA